MTATMTTYELATRQAAADVTNALVLQHETLLTLVNFCAELRDNEVRRADVLIADVCDFRSEF